MADIKIKTMLELDDCCQKHEIIVITRGATATLNFDLTKKIYDMTHIEQLTYRIKQDRNIYSFDMIEYFVLTQDTVAKIAKDYYIKNPQAKTTAVYDKFILSTALEPGSTIPANTYYEKIELPNGQDLNNNWQMNHHFYYDETAEMSWIEFTLSASETSQFKQTAPDNNLIVEVAVRLDTDNLYGLQGRDSIIVERQHPIAVVDSLFGNTASML